MAQRAGRGGYTSTIKLIALRLMIVAGIGSGLISGTLTNNFVTSVQVEGISSNSLYYDYRSYEADTGMYAWGVGEQRAEKYVELLNSLQ